jgi:hypothetical protein
VVADGTDGWSLEDYSWDPKTGVGTYTYEREQQPARVDKERTTVSKAQPYLPSHTGWYTGALK